MIRRIYAPRETSKPLRDRKRQKQVFVSYRQQSPEHARAVRRLGELFRQSKIPGALDASLLNDHPGGPAEGWPKWCEDRANDSEYVLIVASDRWLAA